jgi:hypothetical protein
LDKYFRLADYRKSRSRIDPNIVTAKQELSLPVQTNRTGFHQVFASFINNVAGVNKILCRGLGFQIKRIGYPFEHFIFSVWTKLAGMTFGIAPPTTLR